MPTGTPVTYIPTGTPVTYMPTGTPVTYIPTGTPVTYKPTGTPVTSMPTGTPVTSSKGPTICYDDMETVQPSPQQSISDKLTTDKLFEVSPSAEKEQIVEIEVTGDDKPSILIPSADLLTGTTLNPEDRKALILDLGEKKFIPSTYFINVMTKLGPIVNDLDVWIIKSTHGNNVLVTVFNPVSTKNYAEILGDENPLYDVVEYTSIDQVPETDVPVIIIGKEGSTVSVKKCAESTTPTYIPTTTVPTGTPVTYMPTGTPVTSMPTGTPVTSMPTGTPITSMPTELPTTTGYAPPPGTVTTSSTPVTYTTTTFTRPTYTLTTITPTTSSTATPETTIIVCPSYEPSMETTQYQPPTTQPTTYKPPTTTYKPPTTVTVPTEMTTVPTTISTTYKPTTVATTYKPTTVTPTTEITMVTPSVCEEITKLTASSKSQLPLTPVTITPETVSQESDFEFVVPADVQTTSQVTEAVYSIGVQKVNEDSSIVAFDIEGNFNTYQVIITSSDDTVKGPLADVDGVTTFTPGVKYEFDMITGKLNEDDKISLKFTGPATGFNVNITEFIICLPEFKYCQLTYQDVLRELRYQPLDQVLGTSADDNLEVYYGINMTDGDILEEGVKVFGHCYVCECINFTLTCEIDTNCKCPNYTARCEGDCYNATLIVDFDTAGVDPSCYPNDTCTPEECTTPYDCPTHWAEWSECTECVRTRTRYCDTNQCGQLCNNITTTESDLCGPCGTTETPTTPQPTTPYCDEENEKWECYDHYIMCNESCRTLMNLERCASLNRTDPDMPCNYSCACIDGYKRNSAGKCVKEEECECYNGTIPLPFGYKENVSECRYCECKMNVGYVCHDIPNCCEASEWEEWSPCSASCGNGTRTKTRTTAGSDCSNTTTVEEEVCAPEPCPCIELHPHCLVINNTCNNETHYTEEDPSDPCCVICKPRVEPCKKTFVENKQLKFNDSIYGLCVSQELPMHKCVGSCGFSRSGGNYYAYQNPNSQYPMFDLDYYTDCECCQATMEAKPVEFTCGPGFDIVRVNVTSITACNCMQCK